MWIFQRYLRNAPSLFTICQKNNCYRSTTLLFGLGRHIFLSMSSGVQDPDSTCSPGTTSLSISQNICDPQIRRTKTRMTQCTIWINSFPSQLYTLCHVSWITFNYNRSQLGMVSPHFTANCSASVHILVYHLVQKFSVINDSIESPRQSSNTARIFVIYL